MKYVVAVAALVAAGLPALPAHASAGSECRGVPATIVDRSGDPVDGTAGGDVIVATGTVHAKAGDDLVCGTDIWGERGNDVLQLTGSGEAHGGGGADRVFGSDGADDVGLGPGRDIARLRGGDDFARGENGGDRIFGNSGADHLKGGDHDDYLNGGKGPDTGCGGRDDDVLVSLTPDC